MEALDQLVSTSSSESEIVELSNEQKTMLEMSEKDIKNGQLISQEAMDRKKLRMAKRNVVWTRTADLQFVGILEYWVKRNKSNTYSKKLVRLVFEKNKTNC